MRIRKARERDVEAFLRLAAQVEQWFGPMVAEPGFHRALRTHVTRGTALLAEDGDGPAPLGGLLFDPVRGTEPPVHHLDWLVVSAAARGTGVGRALLDEAVARFVPERPAVLEVVTFGADHPGAVAGGARVFYERLGFTACEPAAPGPEGGSRQVYRRTLAEPAPAARPEPAADRNGA
ncbi:MULTISPECIES: GNAT family N-acetyltransferase [Streptomyces]|uniref:GNAT family N-acetyltransferase n=1 Tax=Streptomyces chilikensis TaxID=1194079 RepID=A0ABV3EXK7_9ACTN|nr:MULTISPECIES: GNAT family N-acetyltransferase [Streptomyces]MDH6226391.1 ribosomal protein S18 acetylase RimI-like enzyme [Streptomyces sp. MJP52]